MLNESALKAQLDELRKSFSDSTREFAAARQELAALSVRTESKDGRISVSLDSAGAVTDITFKNDVHKNLKADELGKKIVAVIAEARTQLQGKISTTMPKPPRGGLDIEKLLDPKTDLLDIL
ncbi:MAG: YbaB/EbfC family nucleoid-associated protein, partial [Angustibacter sp.]